MLRLVAITTFAALGAHTLGAAAADAQDAPRRPRPEDTEVWQPVPPVVRVAATPAPTPPPSDAIILFDGTSLDAWVNARDGQRAGWTVADGVLTVHKPAGDIRTKQAFRDFQFHIEWCVPVHITGEGQGRGNSGLFLATAGSGYELQILDSYQNETYVNGMAGSLYKQAVPLANPTRPPGEWQVYDVLWRAPRFDAAGRLVDSARVTVFFNGVLVQDDFAMRGETRFIGAPTSQPYQRSPIQLQAHGDPSPPISFRNIWLRELPPRASSTPPTE
jgi:hypothetical protein